MWLEAILTEGDVESLITQLTPVRINLGKNDDEERYLHLGRPSAITLAPDKCAVRVVMRAKIRWSLSVLNVPITLDSLQVLLRPTVIPSGTVERGQLAFHLEIEEADFKHIPAFADRQIRQAINTELLSKPLAWDFSSTLTHAFHLPDDLDPLDMLRLDVSWGEVKMTQDALAFAVSFRPTVTRKRVDDDGF